MMLRLALLTCLLVVSASANSAEHRLDCQLDDQNLNKQECLKRGCLWTPVPEGEATHLPACYLDTSLVGYHLTGSITHRDNGLDATLQINPQAHKALPFTPIQKLQLAVSYLSERILRFRITDPSTKRYEVPDVVLEEFNIPSGSRNPNETQYNVSLTEQFNLVVSRKGSDTKIIDTSLGGLIYGDTFLQFVTKVATENVYGIGEGYHTSFKHDFNYKTYPLFSRDRTVWETERNNYGVHPYYTVVEEDGRAHGVLLLNSNAMAYTMLPTPAIAIKTLGGILDFFVFVGDNSEHVTQLYTSVIGRPVMPPFWSLGFQLCRYGYKNLDHVKKVVKRTLDHNVPLDVKYLDIDYMDEHRDFTYDPVNFKGLPEYIKETKEKYNFHWTLIEDPTVEATKPGYHAFDEGYKQDVFIKWPSSVPLAQRSNPPNAPTDKGVMYGHVWPKGPCAFPDFFKNSTKSWWLKMHQELHKTIEFDAIWTDMNEPSNLDTEHILKCPKNNLARAYPSMNFKDSLESNTLCMNAVQGDASQHRHYDVHSLYGWSETKPTYEAVQATTGKRGYVVTRSTFPSSGKYAAHWLGDNYSTWEQMRQSIVGMLEFSLFGISFTGADICGFVNETSPELCRRWHQLGAYYPFSRNHNDIFSADQDPGYWAEHGFPEVTQAAVDSLRTRYQLLHYLYTRFYRAHVHGETVVRPMHHVFPEEPETRGIDTQFFLGPSIMVNPFLFEKQTSVNAYAPVGSIFYKFAGDFMALAERNPFINNFKYIQFHDNESHRPLLFRDGTIFPIVSRQNLPQLLNTANLRKAPIDLWITPHSYVHTSATGDLFYDDGETIDTIEKGNYNYYQFTFGKLEAHSNVGYNLTINPIHTGYKTLAGSKDILQVDAVRIAMHNYNSVVSEATVAGIAAKWTWVGDQLKVETKNLDLLKMSKPTSVLIKFK